MKSLSLVIYFVLAIFVITSETSTIDQIDEKKKIDNTSNKVWLKEVDGYDKNDRVNGYAGIIGKPITSIRVSGGSPYRVHILGKDWLSEVTENNQTDPNGYAGFINGQSIDAFAIDGGVEYAAHILNGDWLPPVNEYDIKDFENGYAGNIGQAIDAIMIQGRTYAVSYTETNIDDSDGECTLQNGTCMNPSNCNGLVLNGLCPGGEDNKCCVPTIAENQNVANNTNTQAQDANNNLNNQNSGSTHLNVYYIISLILAVFIIF